MEANVFDEMKYRIPNKRPSISNMMWVMLPFLAISSSSVLLGFSICNCSFLRILTRKIVLLLQLCEEGKVQGTASDRGRNSMSELLTFGLLRLNSFLFIYLFFKLVPHFNQWGLLLKSEKVTSPKHINLCIKSFA